ncbi:hypothetical protein [Chamaesiphon polymorphus]|uniref:Uncharacterized protein n=1 Tax=Chamaesiphon polymorphus CCALA 037 TaxID=2107692 RepID=A0A2T1GB79_9CYAN|nr:hypothetical protein [Chamaesiphon polymorphus]PSB54562.1 hypothetical protein C7B77_17795 [Chamaesiphon polymorphus CCALA 037]
MNYRYSHRKNPSFDSKLFTVFEIGTIAQVLLPIGGISRLVIAALWGGFLLQFAIAHRRKHQWQWRGCNFFNALQSLCVLGFGVYFCLTVVRSFSKISSSRTRQSIELLNITETFSAGINALPALITGERNHLLSFLLIHVGAILLYALVCLRIAYLSQDEFLKDCQQPQRDRVDPLSMQQFNGSIESSRSIGSIWSFFTSRPFIVEKTDDSVRVEFYKISDRDIQANFPLIGVCLLFFCASLYGIFNTVFIAIATPTTQNLPHSLKLIAFLAPLFPYTIFALISCYALHLLFVKKIVEYKENVLTVGETILGHYRQLFTIDRQDLLPLEEKQKDARVPGVVNSVLLVSQRGRYREIAGHLSPEAMENFKEIYECFRTSSHFNSFYIKTKVATSIPGLR